MTLCMKNFLTLQKQAGRLPGLHCKMGKKISAVLNTYNAEQHLRRVLESLRDFDEILVCDMESTDSTVEIAREYGCRVVTFPRGEHRICEPARDFAVHSAANEWVLVVDADEIVPDELRKYLYDYISDGTFAGALLVPRINTFMGSPINGTPDYQLRFLPRDKTKWPAVIHARPEIDGEIRKIPNRRELSLFHLDNPSIGQRITKMNVYSDCEVPKRMNKKYGVLSMIFRPMFFFLKDYIAGGAFKDGRRGVAKAYMSAIYQMTLLSKLTERQNQPDKDNG